MAKFQEQRGGARAFVRSLNILLKFARLYEFGHAKTMQQFETAWKELRGALEDSGGGGVLLGASGTQILLDGVPLGSAAGERSFAQLLTSSGIASIHFSPTLTQPQFARFVRAFPSGNAKPSSLAEQLKTALAGDTSIKVNEIRYVAEDSSVAGIKVAAQLTQKVLGASGDKFKDFFEDPNKMLQMILAAESMRTGGGGGGMGGAGPRTWWPRPRIRAGQWRRLWRAGKRREQWFRHVGIGCWYGRRWRDRDGHWWPRRRNWSRWWKRNRRWWVGRRWRHRDRWPRQWNQRRRRSHGYRRRGHRRCARKMADGLGDIAWDHDRRGSRAAGSRNGWRIRRGGSRRPFHAGTVRAAGQIAERF
jgi:hypothetical protein